MNLVLAVTLLLAPWTGHALPTSTAAAAKYLLTVRGPPNQSVRLTTSGVATGWIAAFCNDRVCSPSSVSMTLSARGTTAIQFELIREDDGAAKTSGARIEAGGASIVVKPKR